MLVFTLSILLLFISRKSPLFLVSLNSIVSVFPNCCVSRFSASLIILSPLLLKELFVSLNKIPFIFKTCASFSVNGCHPCLISLLAYILLYIKPNTTNRTNINGKNIILAIPITTKEIPATI